MTAAEMPKGPGPMVLREVQPTDVARIAGLEREAFGAGAWSAAVVGEEIAAPGRRTLVAVRGTALLGYAVAWAAGEVADLQRVVVARDARRTGLATWLLKDLLSRAADDGVQRVLLEVSEHNEAALALYRRTGFREIDRRARYFQDGSDALVVQLDLNRPSTSTADAEQEAT